jgi:hypothetical protein
VAQLKVESNRRGAGGELQQSSARHAIAELDDGLQRQARGGRLFLPQQILTSASTFTMPPWIFGLL